MNDATVMQLVARVLDTGCTPEVACREAPEKLAAVREQLRRIELLDAQVEGLFPDSESALLDDELESGSVEGLPHVPGHEVLSVLGHGGMGVVYAARHLKLNRTVAVKMLLGGAHTDAVGLRRLLREAEAVAALDHPNIVQVHEVGENDGLPYFTMELVEGGSLREKIERHILDAREAAALVSILAEAIATAHASGIVHRDLKPANVLLTLDGVPKIADFGLARRIDVESSLTISGAHMGTPSYMAPEQARGDAHGIGPATDVYALGAILYATLTGRPPFRSDMWAMTLRQVVEDEPVRPSRLNPRVPRDLETIGLKCLSKEPTRRYASASALAADLQRYLRGEPILARPIGRVERAGKWVRRRPAQATILAGSVLAVLALTGAALWLGIQRGAIVHAAEQDLLEVDRSAGAADWPGARTALERARARLTDAGSDDLLSRVEQGARELAFVDEMDRIRLNRMGVEYGKRDRRNNSAADSAYEKSFARIGLVDVPRRPQETAARIRSSRIHAVLVSALDTWATCVTGDEARRDGLLSAVRLADPDPTGWRDRVRDPASWNDKPALAELMSAALVPAESVTLLLALAEHVIVAGGDAVPFLQRIQQEHADDYWANFSLGLKVAESSPPTAVRYFQAAVAVRPDDVVSRSNLGTALGASGQIDQAMVQLRKALFLDPMHAPSHGSLSTCLLSKGLNAEAAAELQAFVRLDPSASTVVRVTLAGLLLDLGRLDEASAEFRAALSADPGSYLAHYGLGSALLAAGHSEEASEELQRAIAIQPTTHAHESLSIALDFLGRPDEAIVSLGESVRLDPRRPEPRRLLVATLIVRGRFEEARTAAGSFLESAVGGPDEQAAQALLDHCERIVGFEADLPAILDGSRDPQDGAECLALADLFRSRENHAAAARWYARAFEGGAGTSLGIGGSRTLDAARCAALAAVGKDVGEPVGEEERVRCRARALAWLREDLQVLEDMQTSGAVGSALRVRWGLTAWKSEPALIEFRDAALLERLPEDERSRWRALWSDADALMARVTKVD